MKESYAEIFDNLDKWGNFPGYQLERRADIFFAIHLPEIFKKKYGEEIKCILPEFPVRIGHLKLFTDFVDASKNHGDNQSFNIDYVIVTDKNVYLTELKTDMTSLNDTQKYYLKKSSELSIEKLAGGVIKILSATTNKWKYSNLLDELVRIDWVSKTTEGYVALTQKITGKVIYIQPNNLEDNSNVLSFSEINDLLENSQNPMTLKFRESLTKWSKNRCPYCGEEVIETDTHYKCENNTCRKKAWKK